MFKRKNLSGSKGLLWWSSWRIRPFSVSLKACQKPVEIYPGVKKPW
jgi:hypothetical protein